MWYVVQKGQSEGFIEQYKIYNAETLAGHVQVLLLKTCKVYIIFPCKFPLTLCLLVILILKKPNQVMSLATSHDRDSSFSSKKKRNRKIKYYSFELARLSVASMVPCGSSVGMYTSSANFTNPGFSFPDRFTGRKWRFGILS